MFEKPGDSTGDEGGDGFWVIGLMQFVKEEREERGGGGEGAAGEMAFPVAGGISAGEEFSSCCGQEVVDAYFGWH
jgi:hypothetical protein